MRSLVAIGALCALLFSATVMPEAAFGQQKKKAKSSSEKNERGTPGGEGGAWSCQPDGRGGLKNCVKQ